MSTNTHHQKTHTKLSRNDRRDIALYLQEGRSYRRIGRLMGRSPSTIKDEVARNGVNGAYDWKKAQAKTRLRYRRARFQGKKLRENKGLCAYVEAKIAEDWSPEAVAGRLKYVEPWRGYASVRAIYDHIYSVFGQHLEKHLHYRGKKRGSGSKSPPLAGRTMIDARPKNADMRRVFGHWEADFIVSGKHGSGALLVFVERATRYVLIYKLKDRRAATVNAVLQKVLGTQLVVRSLTLDNDICFRHHEKMSDIVGAPIFFCYPYHSWEKGSVENMNKWVRQYVPKGSDISRYSTRYIRFVEERLNHRPRKCLGFLAPTEKMRDHRHIRYDIIRMHKVATKQKTPVAGCSD